MAHIMKLIWRLDYDVSYEYLDKRGTALAALSNTEKDFWDKIGEGVVNHSFVGKSETEDLMRNISLETTALNGAIEWRRGTNLNRVLQDKSFRGIDRIVKESLNLCIAR